MNVRRTQQGNLDMEWGFPDDQVGCLMDAVANCTTEWISHRMWCRLNWLVLDDHTHNPWPIFQHEELVRVIETSLCMVVERLWPDGLGVEQSVAFSAVSKRMRQRGDLFTGLIDGLLTEYVAQN